MSEWKITIPPGKYLQNRGFAIAICYIFRKAYACSIQTPKLIDQFLQSDLLIPQMEVT